MTKKIIKKCLTCGWNDRKKGSGNMCLNSKQGYNTGMCKDAMYWKPIPKDKKKK